MVLLLVGSITASCSPASQIMLPSHEKFVEMDPKKRAELLISVRDRVLTSRNDSREDVLFIAGALADQDPVVRRVAASSLMRLGKFAEPARALIRATILKYPSSDSATFCLSTLKNVGTSIDDVPLLLDYVTTASFASNRAAGLEALAHTDGIKDVPEIAQRLEPMLAEKDPLILRPLLEVLIQIPDAQQHVERTLLWLADGRGVYQQIAADLINNSWDQISVELRRKAIDSLKKSDLREIREQADRMGAGRS